MIINQWELSVPNYKVMKKVISLLIFLLFIPICLAQEVPLSEVNSNNVLEFYSQIAKTNLAPASVSLSTQVGENNYIEIADFTSNRVQITQLGHGNTTIFQSVNPYSAHAEIGIRGSNNYIHIEGSNSISDGMKMRINANDMTLLMRNR